MLKIKKRHTPQCPHRTAGPEYMNCRCPLRAEGMVDGKRVRHSLRTRDVQRAARRLGELEAAGEPKAPLKTIPAAIAAFLESKVMSEGTRRNYRRTLAKLEELTAQSRLKSTTDINVETIDAYRTSRALSPLSWSKDLERLRAFFAFCIERGWMPANPAKSRSLKATIKPTEKEPFTTEEIIRVIAATGQIGSSSYERLRARAAVLLLRHTGLRISDVALLRRSRVHDDGHVEVHTMKTGHAIRLPIPVELQEALAAVPAPRGTIGVSEYFFWSGNGTTRSAIRDITRTMNAVFLKAEVGEPGKRSHRFRHSLATEILERGGSFEDVELVLGTSAALIRRHYAQWSRKRQERIESLLQTVPSGTDLAQTQTETVIC